MTKFKALLLAGGYGTRLRPLTNTVPKCLVEICGVPLLGRWLQLLEKAKCSEAVVNTHYLHDSVNTFLKTQTYCKFKVREFYEAKLLGTAGTLIANRKIFMNTTGILIHADNAISFDIEDLIKAHNNRPKECLLTMTTFSSDKPSDCGIVICDKNGIVKEFHEKVRKPPSNRANGAIYVFNNAFLDELEGLGPNINDFSTQVLPKFLGKIYAWHTETPFLDIGTPDNLAKAQEIWETKQIT